MNAEKEKKKKFLDSRLFIVTYNNSSNTSVPSLYTLYLKRSHKTYMFATI